VSVNETVQFYKTQWQSLPDDWVCVGVAACLLIISLISAICLRSETGIAGTAVRVLCLMDVLFTTGSDLLCIVALRLAAVQINVAQRAKCTEISVVQNHASVSSGFNG